MTAKGVQMTSKKDEIEEIRQRNEVFKREEYTGDFTSHYMASPKTSLEQVGADIERLLEIIAEKDAEIARLEESLSDAMDAVVRAEQS
jgi:glutaredoxin 2